MHWTKSCLIIRNVHAGQKTLSLTIQLVLTLLICLQCSDNDFGRGDVSRDVLYEPGGKTDLISIVFLR